MRISAAVETLVGDLVSLGALGDDATAGTARRLAEAMRGPVTARLIELLGDVAAELDAAMSDRRVSVRLAGDDARLLLDEEAPPPEAATVEPDGDADARITLRLPGQLKARVEASAAAEGVSVNAYVVRALSSDARAHRSRNVGRRLTGYGRS